MARLPLGLRRFRSPVAALDFWWLKQGRQSTSSVLPEQRNLLLCESQKNLPLEPHLRASEGGKIRRCLSQLCCTFMRGREEAFLPSTIPFTNSSLLFIPHGGLPRFTAGLLTLCNSRQPSTATGRCDSEPEQLLWLLAFLCCFPKVPESNRTHSE